MYHRQNMSLFREEHQQAFLLTFIANLALFPDKNNFGLIYIIYKILHLFNFRLHSIIKKSKFDDFDINDILISNLILSNRSIFSFSFYIYFYILLLCTERSILWKLVIYSSDVFLLTNFTLFSYKVFMPISGP